MCGKTAVEPSQRAPEQGEFRNRTSDAAEVGSAELPPVEGHRLQRQADPGPGDLRVVVDDLGRVPEPHSEPVHVVDHLPAVLQVGLAQLARGPITDQGVQIAGGDIGVVGGPAARWCWLFGIQQVPAE
jgi:hypothetical protein